MEPYIILLQSQELMFSNNSLDFLTSVMYINQVQIMDSFLWRETDFGRFKK